MITIKDKELEKVKIPLNSVYTPVIPCVLDGNLSFLEMVWKLLYHINIIVDSVNANHGDIEDLAQAINELDADKLNVMWVEIDVTARPIKANKTFAEIAEGMRKGIVFATIKQVGTIIAVPVFANDNIITFYFVDNKSSTTIQIKSDESVNIEEYNFAAENRSVQFYEDVTFNNVADFNKSTQFHETTRFYKLITADSGITVPTAIAASARTLAANLEYVGNACSETLTAAKTYADTQDETTLTSAKTYTNNKFTPVAIVKKADGTLTADSTFSKIYLNIIRGGVVDVKFSSENSRNSTYIMRNTIITSTKLTFIGYDETATIHTCTIDRDNNITYT